MNLLNSTGKLYLYLIVMLFELYFLRVLEFSSNENFCIVADQVSVSVSR